MDLSSIFQQATELRASWTDDAVQSLLTQIGKLVNQPAVDWDRGAEEWGRVLVNGQVLAIVCARIPLLIAVSGLKKSMLNGIDATVPLLLVDDMAAKTLSVDKELLEKVFSRRLSDKVDYGRLSIDDLWWATV